MNAEDGRCTRRRSGPRAEVPVAVPFGVAVLLCGVGAFGLLDRTISDRVSRGVEVRGVISNVDRYQIGKFGGPLLRLRVDYDVGGRRRTATLMSMTSADPYTDGESVNVYVSTSAADDVATRDGYASEDWLTQVPVALMAAGLVFTVNGVVSAIRNRKKRRRIGPR